MMLKKGRSERENPASDISLSQLGRSITAKRADSLSPGLAVILNVIHRLSTALCDMLLLL